ncbi:tetratricopeptide repeat protein [Flavobacterium sp.]|uniref:tetratricopeptide repeat protein n=1 Tax=Flavobacterium sp. TaxID=239 RepID=UPI003528DE21
MKTTLSVLMLFMFCVTFSQNYDDAVKKIENKFYDYSLNAKELDSMISVCPDISQYPKLHYYKAMLYFDKDNYSLAIKSLLDSKKYAKSYDLRYNIYTNLGTSYSITKQDNLAIAAFSDALKLSKTNNDKEKIDQAYENLLIAKIEQGDLQSLKEFENHFFEKDYDYNLCLKLENIGLISGYYIDNNLYNDSQKFLRNVDINANAIDSCYIQKQMYYGNLADISIYNKKYNKALVYLDSIPLKLVKLKTDKLETYKYYKKAYQLLGNSDIATAYNDSIVSILEKNLEDFNTANTLETIEVVNNQELTNEKISTLKIILYIILSIVIGLIIWLFYLRKNRNKLKQKLFFYRENYNSLWTSYKLSNKQLENLKAELSNQDNSNNTKISAVLKDLSLYLNTNSDNEHKYINSVKNDFINKLSENAPFLSEKEKLMCFFFSLNIPHKKIAEMVNRTEKSIDSYKYRINSKIKSKLKIDFDTFTKSFKIN